jgi:hypothetical protein
VSRLVGSEMCIRDRNYDEALGKLRAWLLSHPEAKIIGEPYAVYWNSPFVPFFLKKSEVHLPVQLLPAK